MPSTVLILTQPGDIHAYAVSIALRRRGAEPILWHTTDFPHQEGESFLVGARGATFSIDSPTLLLSPDTATAITAVWRRRPGTILNKEVLHPADQDFAETECKIFRQSILDNVAKQAFWVNPHSAAVYSNSKLTQQIAASESDLLTPLTLYSNDPKQIRAFIKMHPEGVVYKPFRGVGWQRGESQWASYTAAITEENLVDDEILRLTPGVYQVLVPKAYELRITVMGHEAFTVKILSQQTTQGRLDWRRAYEELSMQPCELPEKVRRSCIALMERLGLVFGCLDFIVTPTGEYVFLEINEMGQFLFLERYTGLPLLDSFAAFLLQGSETFRWAGSQGLSPYTEIYPEAEKLAEQEEAYHVEAPPRNLSKDAEVSS